MNTRRQLATSAAFAALLLAPAACGGSSAESADPTASGDSIAALDTASGIRRATAADAAAMVRDDDVVVLDIRTPEEFAEGRVKGATMIDFYEPDFADRLAELDRQADYVVYCRSGNRSGEAMKLFSELGFVSVTEIDGGVIAWLDAGLPLVR